MPDDFYFNDLYADAEYDVPGLTGELVGATTTPIHAGAGVPEAVISGNVSVHLAPEDPIFPSQSYPSSENGPGL